MVQYDPFRPDLRRDPYPAYRELRERAPVHRAPDSGIWCVSRYDDVQYVLRTPELFSSRAMFTMLMNNGQEGPPPLSWKVVRFLARMAWRTRMNPFEFARARNLISEDGERHTALRAVVNRGFTPRRIAGWEKRIAEIVEECLGRARYARRVELIEELASPLPVRIIAEMLGIEPERQRDFKRWSDIVVRYATGEGRADPFALEFAEAAGRLFRYVYRFARRRRADPTDDLVSAIVAEQEGETALSDREVIQFVVLLLVAGNETTTNLIGNAVDALLAHPETLARLADDPSLAPAVVEETLRWNGPVQLVFRNTTREAEVAGVRIPQGAFVAALIGSANRDERRFPDAERFDVDRDTRGHVAFGFGKHFCLGASLARLEARIALERLAPVLRAFERGESGYEPIDSFLVRGPRRLVLARAAA